MLDSVAGILCFDFDDTVILENSTRLIFEKFATGHWRALEAEYHAGKMTVEQFNIAAFDLVEASEDDLIGPADRLDYPRLTGSASESPLGSL